MIYQLLTPYLQANGAMNLMICVLARFWQVHIKRFGGNVLLVAINGNLLFIVELRGMVALIALRKETHRLYC